MSLPRRAHRLTALTALTAVVAAADLHAYVRAPSQWNPASLPIRYRVNTASAPPSLGPDVARSAVDAGFASWAAPTCTNWRATNAGASTVSRGSTGDGENSILWLSGAWPAELGDVSVVIGVTTPVWRTGGGFIDADIQFNNVGFRWSTTGASGTVDTQSIATHEEGHFLGLNHSATRTAIMFASYSGGIKRTLDADDIAGVCALYPSGGPVPDAGVSDPCAGYTSCAGCTPVDGCGWCAGSGRCVSGTPTGPVSGTCASGYAWNPTDCTTTPPPPVDAGPTTDPCATYTSCGTCTPVNGCGFCGATNRCMSSTTGTGPSTGTCASGWAWNPTDCTAGTASFGEPCTRSTDCSTGGPCVSITVGGVRQAPFCTRSCSDDCTCPRGYRCAMTATAGLSLCITGTNTCSMGTDAGTPVVDVPVAPRDVPVATPDVPVTVRDVPVTAVDVPVTMNDSGLPDVGGNEAGTPVETVGGRSGCGCEVPGARFGLRGESLFALALGVCLSARRRRRR